MNTAMIRALHAIRPHCYDAVPVSDTELSVRFESHGCYEQHTMSVDDVVTLAADSVEVVA